jgi:hypothetical protein
MSVSRSALISLLVAAAPALGHPGHGKPGFIHTHTWAQLADWAANAALIYLFLFAAGAACWAVNSALRRKRK